MVDVIRTEETDSGLCLFCREPETTIVRLTDTGRLTKTETKICQAKHCGAFLDIEKIRTWVIKNYDHYSRDFQRGLSLDFNPLKSNRQKTKEATPVYF